MGESEPRFFWESFLKQDKKCALTGIELVFAFRTTKRGMWTQTASLDRIDSSKGYTKDNIQWVHKRIQKMKMDMDNTEFIDWCNKVKLNK